MWKLMHSPELEASDAWAALDDIRRCGGTECAADILAFLLGPLLPAAQFNRIKAGMARADASAIEDLMKRVGL